jgi:hypothetical protein
MQFQGDLLFYWLLTTDILNMCCEYFISKKYVLHQIYKKVTIIVSSKVWTAASPMKVIMLHFFLINPNGINTFDHGRSCTLCAF